MSETSTTPFDSIESAHEYIGLLCEALDDAHRTIGQEIADPCEFTGARHLDALRLADYKLKSLRQHFVASRRLLILAGGLLLTIARGRRSRRHRGGGYKDGAAIAAGTVDQDRRTFLNKESQPL